MDEIDISKFLDKDGKIKVWPAKHQYKREVVRYLSKKFVALKSYTEKEVNEIIKENHTFNDYFILRRSLIDYGFLKRLADGSKYWKEEEE